MYLRRADRLLRLPAALPLAHLLLLRRQTNAG